MKRLLPFFSIAVLMAACNTGPKTGMEAATVSAAAQQAPAMNPDTIGLAQFQDWKAQNELAKEDSYQQEDLQYAAAPVKKAKKVAPAPTRKTIKSNPIAKAKPAAQPRRAATSAGSGGSGTADSNDGAVVSSESANEAKEPAKEGWSKAAKGTAIGAGTGAVVGAVINKKNRVIGGVIGGVVGGAVGYGVGRVLDKKDGRK